MWIVTGDASHRTFRLAVATRLKQSIAGGGDLQTIVAAHRRGEVDPIVTKRLTRPVRENFAARQPERIEETTGRCLEVKLQANIQRLRLEDPAATGPGAMGCRRAMAALAADRFRRPAVAV